MDLRALCFKHTTLRKPWPSPCVRFFPGSRQRLPSSRPSSLVRLCVRLRCQGWIQRGPVVWRQAVARRRLAPLLWEEQRLPVRPAARPLLPASRPGYYFVISRGFCILPPELAASFPSNDADNYRSAEDNDEEVDAEI